MTAKVGQSFLTRLPNHLHSGIKRQPAKIQPATISTERATWAHHANRTLNENRDDGKRVRVEYSARVSAHPSSPQDIARLGLGLVGPAVSIAMRERGLSAKQMGGDEKDIYAYSSTVTRYRGEPE